MVEELTAFDLIVPAVVTGILLGFWVRGLLGIRAFNAVLISLGVNAALVVWLLTTGFSSQLFIAQLQRLNPARTMIVVIALFVVTNLGLSLLIKNYRAAVLDRATPDERSSGIVGIRAWLSPLNVSTAVALVISACLGLDATIFGAFLVAAFLLLAYPLTNTLMMQTPTPAAPPQAPAEERERVLALVEAGKISAEDAAELLGALAQSQSAQTEAAAVISAPRRIILAGSAVVLLAFFLPWFTLNESQAMRDAMGNLQASLPQFSGAPNSFESSPAMAGMPMAVNTQKTIEMTLRGGDVRNGLGWIALIAGLCVPSLPFFWTPRPGQSLQQRNIILAVLAAGTVALLYLLSNSFNSITSIEPGFMIAMAGYALLWFGSVREYVKRGAANPVRLAVA